MFNCCQGVSSVVSKMKNGISSKRNQGKIIIQNYYPLRNSYAAFTTACLNFFETRKAVRGMYFFSQNQTEIF